jgi:hypothetical protein
MIHLCGNVFHLFFAKQNWYDCRVGNGVVSQYSDWNFWVGDNLRFMLFISKAGVLQGKFKKEIAKQEMKNASRKACRRVVELVMIWHNQFWTRQKWNEMMPSVLYPKSLK